MIKAINKRLRNKKGFTLIELVVVVAVLGIISALVIPRFTNITDSAKANVDEQNRKLLQNAIELYAAENGNYPSSDEDIDKLISDYLDQVPEVQSADNKAFFFNKNTNRVEIKADDFSDDDYLKIE
ncbi:type II secretion system protein [Caloranaerobacter ferrireducens]|uniref:type II secretion system protein n=1 Tax=Caloranaerobacter ferrireducens TaxID=1323370 RepID=UPI00084D2C1D|nr:prepilin-type N-terminal cleavage/methylation domain-containing protein [Caloranaerobacter ferrireducens]